MQILEKSEEIDYEFNDNNEIIYNCTQCLNKNTVKIAVKKF